jgi:hypothetical protein
MMNEIELAEVETMADRVLSMADSWVRNPLAQTTSIEEDIEFQQLDAARDEVKPRAATQTPPAVATPNSPT